MWKSPLDFEITRVDCIFLTSGVKLHIHLLNVVVQFIVFLTLSTLICRGTDISKCFSESLGSRDNESRLYFYFVVVMQIFNAARHLRQRRMLNVHAFVQLCFYGLPLQTWWR